MVVGKRFVAWSLVGIVLALGWQGCGPGLRGVGAIQVMQHSVPATTTPITQQTEGWLSEADELSLPESSSESEPIEAEDTLSLPDFEPQLPGESLPETPPAEEDNASELPADPSPETEETLPGDDDPAKLSKQQQILMTADEHYLAGDRETAEILYRQVKDAVWQVDPESLRPLPIDDAADLPPAGKVYWREAQAGYEQGLTHRTLVPLELLVQEYPQFIPAQVFYAEYLIEQERAEEADAILDQALVRYPSQPDLLKARTTTQMALEQWIEAAITARQFVLLNPDHPDAATMDELSQRNLEQFRAATNEELTGNLIGNIITGAAGLLLTGGLIGPYTAINSAIILLQGESTIGANVAEQVKDQLPIITDPEVDAYINGIGQKLANLSGRDEFEYEFYVIDDPDLNAFALPGGKVFINAGAILKAESEAELAGLLAHELAHAVLSHGFQMVTNGNLISSVAGAVPLPEVSGIAANLVFSEYSRQMERQADILGTQLLAVGGYAADGLHNLMVTLREEASDRGGIQWFSSHPAPAERVDYLKQIVEVGGYNRYAYEGIATHLAVQQRVEQLMSDAEETE